MPAVDRCVLRIAVYELMDEAGVPVAVVLDEAVELAKRYSTEDSGRYVNGVLSGVAKEVRPEEMEANATASVSRGSPPPAPSGDSGRGSPPPAPSARASDSRA